MRFEPVRAPSISVEGACLLRVFVLMLARGGRDTKERERRSGEIHAVGEF